MTDLQGRVALITGAQQGIGAACALAMAQAGADIAVNWLDLEPLELAPGRFKTTSLDGASLRYAVLTRAKLRRTIATTADFTQCDLSGAALKEADFTGAKLGGIKVDARELLTAVLDPVLADRLRRLATNS
jgi:uncharacterized protein YjbI with pentapeptide repeats